MGGPAPDGEALRGAHVERSIDFTFDLGPTLRVNERPVANATPPSVEDVAVVADARAGDREAFGHLYNRYARMVHGILLARVPRAAVDDLVQDVFLLALRRLHTLRDLTAFGGWLAMITRNRAKDFFRRSPQMLETELTENPSGPEVERPGPSAEALAALGAVRGLPEAYRETLILRLVEGMTGPEIAARTGLTPGSVRVNLHRGMEMLREKLGKA
jgi:RNA polymerase sigma-70 factor (ECF subfamily)